MSRESECHMYFMVFAASHSYNVLNEMKQRLNFNYWYTCKCLCTYVLEF